MRSILMNCTIIFTFFSINLCSQNLTVQDSIQIFSDSLFDKLENKYLFRKNIAWNHVKHSFKKRAIQHKTFEASLKETTALFDTIGCEHCMLFSKKGYYPATQKKSLLFKDYSSQFVKKYQNASFEVSLLDNTYGYVIIPGMLFLDVPQDTLNIKAQNMYNQIRKLNNEYQIKGWIIDLRFNVGGDAYLMLTALYHLLGDKTVYNTLNLHQEIAVAHSLKNGAFYAGDQLKMTIEADRNADTETPVVLIIGNWTASAGECVVLGFKDRKNVLSVGEPTYGFLTGNELFKLPFGIKAPLTTSYLADMYGHYSEHLKPNIYIKHKDNFDNLLQDGNIIEAIKFINSKQ